jgi:polysaccharide biosynthesis transport protein
MRTTADLAAIPPVTRVESPDPRYQQAQPLLRLHLLLYGRYTWALLLGLVLAACGVAIVWVKMPPKYEVTGYIRIKSYIAPILSPTDQTGMLPMFDAFVSLQVSLLQSRRVLDQASLNPEWKALEHSAPGWSPKIPADRLAVDRPRSSEIISVGYTDRNASLAATAVRAILKSYEAMSADLEGGSISQRMQVLEDLRTSLTDQQRSLSNQILNLANQYGSDELQGRYRFKMEQQSELELELQRVQLEISIVHTEAGADATAQRSAGQGPSSPPASNSTAAPLTQPAPATLTREDVARMDAEMRECMGQELQLVRRLNQLQLRLGANHPDVVSTHADLQLLEDRMDSLLAAYQARADKTGNPLLPPVAGSGTNKPSLTELKARESNIRAMWERLQSETKVLGQQDLQIRKLKADRDAVLKKLDETSARIDQLNLESTIANRISILSYGESPTAPLPNKRFSWAFAVSLLGLVVGAGLAALRGWADSRVASLLHMQHLTPTLNVLGTLPVLPNDLEDSVEVANAAQCVHQIRNLLDTLPDGDRGRALAITSPTAGDGKTGLTLALGLSFAASGTRTLLIDCDMVGGGLTRRLNAIVHRRLGSILQRQGLLSAEQLKEALAAARDSHKKLGEVIIARGYASAADVEKALAGQMRSSVGLLEALNGEPLSACTTSVVREGLYVLPLGDASSALSSRVSSKALARVLREARKQFDLVIVDTGPLLGSLEAAIAARETDQVVLTISRGSPSALVMRTVQLLGTLGAHLGGVVLNRATPADIAYSHYGSSIPFLHASTEERFPPRPEPPMGTAPRLGPIAAAVVSAGVSPADGTRTHGAAGQGRGANARPTAHEDSSAPETRS